MDICTSAHSPRPFLLKTMQLLSAESPNIAYHFWPRLLLYGFHPFQDTIIWMLTEFHGVSLKSAMDDNVIDKNDVTTWWSCVLQVAMALHVIDIQFSATHTDVHPGNLVIQKKPKPITIHLITPVVNITHRTDVTVKLIDFGRRTADTICSHDSHGSSIGRKNGTTKTVDEVNSTDRWYAAFVKFIEKLPNGYKMMGENFKSKLETSRKNTKQLFTSLQDYYKKNQENISTSTTFAELNGYTRFSLSAVDDETVDSTTDGTPATFDHDVADDTSVSSCNVPSAIEREKAAAESATTTGKKRKKLTHIWNAERHEQLISVFNKKFAEAEGNTAVNWDEICKEFNRVSGLNLTSLAVQTHYQKKIVRKKQHRAEVY